MCQIAGDVGVGDLVLSPELALLLVGQLWPETELEEALVEVVDVLRRRGLRVVAGAQALPGGLQVLPQRPSQQDKVLQFELIVFGSPVVGMLVGVLVGRGGAPAPDLSWDTTLLILLVRRFRLKLRCRHHQRHRSRPVRIVALLAIIT